MAAPFGVVPLDPGGWGHMPISDEYPYVDVALTEPRRRVETHDSLLDKLQSRFALQCLGVLFGGFLIGVVAEWVISPDVGVRNGVRISAGTPSPWGPTDFETARAPVASDAGGRRHRTGMTPGAGGRLAGMEPAAGDLLSVLSTAGIEGQGPWPEDLPPRP